MEIKTPVRYDHIVECLQMADGEFIGLSTDQCDDDTNATGEYIALCINDHAKLTARVQELEQQVERYRKARLQNI